MAPSFSNTNLYKQLPELQRQTAEFTSILDDHILLNKTLEDFSHWMQRLTIGFIATTMFDQDFSCLSDEQDAMSKGNIYMTQIPIALKEYVVKQNYNFFRRFMFWSKEYKDASRAVSLVAKTGQSILDDYRVKHSEEETESDTSIIGHLMRRCVNYCYTSQ